jgi:hypothetical protein
LTGIHQSCHTLTAVDERRQISFWKKRRQAASNEAISPATPKWSFAAAKNVKGDEEVVGRFPKKTTFAVINLSYAG